MVGSTAFVCACVCEHMCLARTCYRASWPGLEFATVHPSPTRRQAFVCVWPGLASAHPGQGWNLRLITSTRCKGTRPKAKAKGNGDEAHISHGPVPSDLRSQAGKATANTTPPPVGGGEQQRGIHGCRYHTGVVSCSLPSPLGPERPDHHSFELLASSLYLQAYSF